MPCQHPICCSHCTLYKLVTALITLNWNCFFMSAFLIGWALRTKATHYSHTSNAYSIVPGMLLLAQDINKNANGINYSIFSGTTNPWVLGFPSAFNMSLSWLHALYHCLHLTASFLFYLCTSRGNGKNLDSFLILTGFFFIKWNQKYETMKDFGSSPSSCR